MNHFQCRDIDNQLGVFRPNILTTNYCPCVETTKPPPKIFYEPKRISTNKLFWWRKYHYLAMYKTGELIYLRVKVSYISIFHISSKFYQRYIVCFLLIFSSSVLLYVWRICNVYLSWKCVVRLSHLSTL